MNTGQFSANWKEALVTPILQKVSPEDKENYRPVSNLPAASKLLEMVVCEQVYYFLESNGLLPKNQKSFKSKRWPWWPSG